jgi:hypothetical protein
MDPPSCNLSAESFTATDTEQFCGEVSGTFPQWRLFSQSEDHVIRISDANLSIVLDSVILSGTTPFSIENSTVSITYSGMNSFEGDSGAILCTEDSNVTFIANSSDAELVALSHDSESAAIGTNETCGFLHFIGGTVYVDSTMAAGLQSTLAAGIGSWATESNISIGAIIIEGCRVHAYASLERGAGIGCSAVSGCCAVGMGWIRILNSELTLLGCGGIGSGLIGGNASVWLVEINISDSVIFIPRSMTGIGLSMTSESARSWIGEIQIVGSGVDITGQSAIGTGAARNDATVWIQKIIIGSCQLSLRSSEGAGIGSGMATDNARMAINNLTVNNCSGPLACSSAGSCIGTGLGTVNSTQLIDMIAISSADLQVSGIFGACIGVGATSGDVRSCVDEINGTGSISRAFGGNRIGTGRAEGNSFVRIQSLVVDESTLSLETDDGPGIGCFGGNHKL